MNNVLTTSQFDLSEIEHLLRRASEMEEILKTKGHTDIAKGKILAAIFYEPSTRTRLSFETAMHRLGGGVISETDVHFSSRAKGEVLEDTSRMVGGYADIIAIRSKEVGDAQIVADYSGVPVLNAGDGSGEHPTQSLLDLYTISKHFDLNKPLEVSFVGDLKYGRTVHSLCTILRNFPQVKITFVAPPEVQIPEKYKTPEDRVLSDLTDEILQTSDVIYDTRIQKERFEDLSDYEKVKEAFVFTPELVNKMKKEAILLHPLPRINEITQDVDSLPQAKYFEQARNGVPMRMALIAELLGL